MLFLWIGVMKGWRGRHSSSKSKSRSKKANARARDEDQEEAEEQQELPMVDKKPRNPPCGLRGIRGETSTDHSLLDASIIWNHIWS